MAGVASDDHGPPMQDDSLLTAGRHGIWTGWVYAPTMVVRKPAGLRNVLRQFASSGVGKSSSGSRPSNGRVK